MDTFRTLSFVLCLGFINACSAILGEEVARLPINQVSTDDDNLIIKEVTLDLKKDEDISFWSEMDVEYEGDINLRFRVDVLINGDFVDKLEFDPMEKNITLTELRSTVMDKTTWSFTGKNAEILMEEGGNYTFRGVLSASENATLIINKAELIIRK